MRRLLNRIANPVVTWLLRSSLHGILSGSTLLITVTGRKSGRSYTIPVNYVRDSGALAIFSRRDRTWWRNLEGGATVTGRVRGQDLKSLAIPMVLTDEALAETLIRHRRISPGKTSHEQACRIARNVVMIRVELT